MIRTIDELSDLCDIKDERSAADIPCGWCGLLVVARCECVLARRNEIMHS